MIDSSYVIATTTTKEKLMGEQLCTDCGTEMFVMPNPSIELLERTDGFHILRGHLEEHHDMDVDLDDVQLAACLTCPSTAVIGPTVMIDGTIAD